LRFLNIKISLRAGNSPSLEIYLPDISYQFIFSCSKIQFSVQKFSSNDGEKFRKEILEITDKFLESETFLELLIDNVEIFRIADKDLESCKFLASQFLEFALVPPSTNPYSSVTKLHFRDSLEIRSTRTKNFRGILGICLRATSYHLFFSN